MKRTRMAVTAVALILPALMLGSRIAAAERRPAKHASEGRGVLGIAAQAGQYRTLLSLIIAADLVDALRSDGPFTVFAPTDEAFAKLPKGTLETLLKPESRDALRTLLSYHVVPKKILSGEIDGRERPRTLAGRTLTVGSNSKGVFVNEATVVQADLDARNGVVHGIDRVLTPGKAGVLETAEKAGKFKLLLAAVKATKLDAPLGGDGPFTILAPTDEAFEKLGHDTLDELLRPKNREKLREILKYHVVEGKLSARRIANDGAAKTLQGQPVKVDIQDGRLTVNGAKVILNDLEAENGVIHVIDSVLIPPKS